MKSMRNECAKRSRLEISGVIRLIIVNITVMLQPAIVFLAAGTIDIRPLWLYVGLTYTYFVIAITVMLKCFPDVIELINERGKVKKDVKAWDKVFGALYTMLYFIMPLIAGLDIGRFHWSHIDSYYLTPGIVLSVFGLFLIHWAMVVNKYAETGVRIQNDRDQHVISSGPYRFVRHPFYIAIILATLSFPLIVGSAVAYIPAMFIISLFVVRTALEDRTLQRELKGYFEYTQQVAYRLIPGIW